MVLVRKQTVILTLLTLFFASWIYTEVAEYLERDHFREEVYEFMDDGARFTRKDGEALEERIEQLEKEVSDG